MTNVSEPVRTAVRVNALHRVLTVIAVLLAVLVLHVVSGVPPMPEAAAQQTPTPTLPNAATQRLKMIAALEKIDARLAKIEQKLSAPLDVNVAAMPEVRIQE